MPELSNQLENFTFYLRTRLSKIAVAVRCTRALSALLVSDACVRRWGMKGSLNTSSPSASASDFVPKFKEFSTSFRYFDFLL